MDTFESYVELWVSNENNVEVPIVDPPYTKAYLFSSLVYYKAAWVLRMLRDIVGKPAFDAAVTSYLTTHAFGNAVTDDFRAAVEAEYGQPLDWFFDQWLVTGIGSPQLAWVPVFSQTPSGWLVQVDITQTQETPTLFTLLLEARVTTAAGDTTVSGWVSGAHDVLAFPVNAQPLSVGLDPNNKMLGGTYQVASTSVRDMPRPPLLRAWPNPFFRALTIDTGDIRGRIGVFDVTGRRVALLAPAGGARVTWDGTDARGRPLPSGTYFLRPEETGESYRIVRLFR
jgi:hypothetical protein